MNWRDAFMRRSLQPLDRSRSIGARLGWNLAAVGLVGMSAIGLFLTQSIMSNFSSLEREQVGEHASRATNYLEGTKSSLDSKVKDWAFWDASYEYVQDFNPDYETENLNYDSMKNYAVDGLAFVRYQDLETRSYFFDHASGELDAKRSKELIDFARTKELVIRTKHAKTFQQFTIIGGKLVVAAVARITRSDNSGEPPGFLVFVRSIQSSEIKDALQLPSRIVLQKTASETATFVHDDHIDIVKPIVDGEGEAIAALSFKVDRTMVQRGWQMLWLTLACIGAMLVAMVLLINLRVRSVVALPLAQFRDQVDRIRETGDLATLHETKRADEIGILHRAFNSMARELDSLRMQNEAQSFAIGRSQSAIGVMHNVRNGLSPLNVFLSRLGDQLAEPAMPHARQALEELSRTDIATDRRDKLTAFLSAFLDQIDRRLVDKQELLGHARQNVGAVLEAIELVQQADQGVSSTIESCDIMAILRQSSTLLPLDLDHGAELVIPEIQPVMVAGNRILLGQVIGNLFRNASESIAAGHREDGRIEVTLKTDAIRQICEIRIRDNGEGFDQEASKRLFERGYSTRQEKAGGLGLHWCANSINAMQGRLALESDGPGKGAVAILELPVATIEHAAKSMPVPVESKAA